MDIDAVIDTYYRKIYKLSLFYLNHDQEAEELTQEIFIKVLKKKSTFKGESNIYTWLYRIAVNTLLNYINRKKIVEFISFETIPHMNEKIHEATDIDTDDPALRLEKEELNKLKVEQLERCLRQLSNREKTAFYFFHYDGLKQKEIAEIMRTSVSAVESLVHKGMKKIKRCVGT